MLFGKRKNLIIEITDTVINLLEVGCDSKNRCFKAEKVSLEKGTIIQGELIEDGKFTELLQNWRKENYKNKAPGVILLTPSPNCILRDFTLPWINEKERDNAVIYQAAQEIPVPLSELYYQYEIEIMEIEKSLLVHFMAVKKSIMQRYVDGLSRAGFRIIFTELAVTLIGKAVNSFFAEEYILSLKEVDNLLLHLVLYKNCNPCLAKYITYENAEIVEKYLIQILQGVNLDKLRVISDGSSQAEKVILELFRVRISLSKNLIETDFSLLGFWQKNNDFFQMSRLQKKNIQGRSLYYASGIFSLVITLIAVFWYCLSKYHDINILQKDIAHLSQVSEITKRDDLVITASDSADLTKEDLRLLLKTVETEADGITIKRMNIKDKGLMIWAESKTDANIMALNNLLNLCGWQKHVLVQYKYEQDKGIGFCISAQKSTGF